MSMGAGLTLMLVVFLLVWLVFVIYGEVSIRRDKEGQQGDH